MQQPLVSILIPVKNTEKFLHECLQSTINQTYTNWEVLAVNDHSTDKSENVLQCYAKKDSRIKIFNQKEQGILPALQKAYHHSKGHLITRMDSDDIMKPDKLHILVQKLLKNGKGHLAVGQVKYFSDQGICNGYERYARWLNMLTRKGNNYSEIYKECVIPSPCWMVYRSDLEHCGAFNTHRYPEDYDLAFRFYENGLNCIACAEVLHLWRDYNSRTSRTHEHYAQNYFLDIKLHYFLKLHYNPKRPLVIWGAGKKGKTLAKKLIEKKIDFYWICNNTNKIGKEIYGKQMLHFKRISQLNMPKTIITVANKEEQEVICNFLLKLNQKNMEDYYFFC